MAAVKLLLLSAVLVSAMVVCWTDSEQPEIITKCPDEDVPMLKEIIELCKGDCADPKCSECGECIVPKCLDGLSIVKKMLNSTCREKDSTFTECNRCYGEGLKDCMQQCGLVMEE